MRLALYQPDIPQNTGTMLRLAACLGVAADIIEPAGFPVTDKHFRRSGMDYLDQVEIIRHPSWRAFYTAHAAARARAAANREADVPRLVLATTRADIPLHSFSFRTRDTIMLGRESAGVPDDVHDAADARVFIPLKAGLRSLNVAMAAAMLLGEALRQTGAWSGMAQPAGVPARF